MTDKQTGLAITSVIVTGEAIAEWVSTHAVTTVMAILVLCAICIWRKK